MPSKIDPIILNGHNYAIWLQDMETLLKSKGIRQYMKTIIPYLKVDQVKFVINEKKYEAIGIITTYISRDIYLHTSKIDCPHEAWKKMKLLLDKIDKSQVMWNKKELISLDHDSCERVEDYLACVKELQLKLGECGMDF